jgi:two-component system sensor kinase FixL
VRRRDRNPVQQDAAGRARQRALAALSQRALGVDDPQALMDEAVADAARYLGSEYAAVFELLPGGRKMRLRAGVGWKPGLLGRITVDAGARSLAGYTLRSDAPLIANDLRTEARFKVPPVLAEHRLTRGITVNIKRRGQPFGVLGVFAARRRSYSADDADFLQTVANVSAIAMAWKDAEQTERRLRGRGGEPVRRSGAEAVLRESEEKYRRLMNLLPVAIYACDAEGIITFYNERAPEVWGRSPKIGDPAQRFCGSFKLRWPDGRPLPHDQSPMRETLRDGTPFRNRELIIEQRGGRRFHVLVNIDPIRDAGGRIVGAINAFSDVTALKQAEKEILEIGEREQRRIGQDLHDDLGQQLTGIALTARLLEQRLVSRAPSAAAVAKKIVQSAQQATARARQLARGLYPVRLEADGLAAALRELAASVETVFRIRCHFRSRGTRKGKRVAEPSVAIQLYRIAQEAATNSVKHGRAKNISIQLSVAKGRLKLCVADDGVGIADERPNSGMGVPIMNQRARAVGAALSIARRTGGGTLVTCSVGIGAKTTK